MISFGSQTHVTPNKHVLGTSDFFFFSLTSRRAMTSDSWLIQWRTQEVCFFWEGGGSTNSVEDRGRREQGSGDGSPLVRGSRGSCYLVQEISFHIVKFP